MKPYAAVGPLDHTRQPAQGPRHRSSGGLDRPRRARCRHRRSRSITRRKAWRQAELQNRWHGLRFEGTKWSSHPGRSQEKNPASSPAPGPRTAPTRDPDLGDRPPERGPYAAARSSASGTAGTALGVSPGRWWSVGTAGRRAVAATAALLRGTQGYSSGPGDGSAGTASRTL